MTFAVSADPKAPVGQRPSLFCQVTVMKDGERMVHNLARGGVLRIVPAAGAKKESTAAKATGATVAKEGK